MGVLLLQNYYFFANDANEKKKNGFAKYFETVILS